MTYTKLFKIVMMILFHYFFRYIHINAYKDVIYICVCIYMNTYVCLWINQKNISNNTKEVG